MNSGHANWTNAIMAEIRDKSSGSFLRYGTIRPIVNNDRGASSGIPHCCREERPLYSTVNFDLVAGWLERCDEHHDHSSITLHSPDEIIGFRFIDVQNRCIVRASHHVRYAALSYTWGSRKQYCLTKQNTCRLEVNGSFDGLEEELGPTVLDSIKVCSRLIIPYLWIDALCIVQDDTENKHSQIKIWTMCLC
jgi:hypothetical protein